MATTKPRTETKRTTIERLHAAYLEAKIDADHGTARVLRALAKRFGVPFAEADRAHCLGGWELERQGLRAEAWHKEFGHGARTEDEYAAYCVREHYGHLTAKGPEGSRLAEAHGRDIWRRAMGPALEWRAREELDRARAEYDAIEEVRRKHARLDEMRKMAEIIEPGTAA